MTSLLRLDKISLSYGSRPLLDAASLQLEQGERVALIGRNGEGKSLLLRLLRAEVEPDQGTMWLRTGARVALLPQDVLVTESMTIAEWVAGGLAASSAGIADPVDATDSEGWSDARRVATVLSRLQLDPAARLDQLSGGTRRRALLA